MNPFIQHILSSALAMAVSEIESPTALAEVSMFVENELTALEAKLNPPAASSIVTLPAAVAAPAPAPVAAPAPAPAVPVAPVATPAPSPDVVGTNVTVH